MTIAKLARPEIQGLRAYEAAIQVEGTVRLNANEAPWTSTADHFRRPLNRYPEIRPASLRSSLANHYGCDPENLLVTRGTSEAIDLLVRVFCREGKDNIVTSFPTFSMYRHYAKVQGAECREVPGNPDDNFALDPDAMLAACDDLTRLIFVCSPNNPTGTLVPAGVLTDLASRRGDRSVIVVDEAYIEFSGVSSSVGLLADHDNLVVLRTLSKALAFAGARCGSVIGPESVIRLLDAVQAPYALATPVVECVENALQERRLEEANQRMEEIVAERARLTDELSGFKFVRKIWPSAANFFLVEVSNAIRLMQHTASEKVLLRYFGGDLADCVRITVGTREENDRLLQTLQALPEN